MRMGFRLFLICTALVSASPACTCVSEGTVCESARSANTVFVGKAVSRSQFTVVFEATETFQGIAPGRIEVNDDVGMSSCAYGFVVGQEYLVYATRTDNSLYTSGC